MTQPPKEHYSFSLWQDGIKVAGVYTTDYEAGKREILHYAMVYSQDGPVKIRWPRNTPMSVHEQSTDGATKCGS